MTGRYLDAYPYAVGYDKSKMIGLNPSSHRSQVGLSSMMTSSGLAGQPGMLGHHPLSGLPGHAVSIAQSHLPTHHEQEIINKRPRLYVESKVSIHQPLRIETQDSEVKKV